MADATIGGGGSPTYGSILNKPDLPEGFSAARLASFMNNNAAFHERSDLEQGLNAWNMDDGFIDIFWDESKISSKTNVSISTGSNPTVKISKTTGSSVSVTDSFNTESWSDHRGIRVNPNNDLDGLKVTIASATSGFSTLYVYDSSNTKQFEKDVSGLSGGDTVTIDFSFSSGNDYQILLDNGGSSYTSSYNDKTTPITSADVDIVNGIGQGVGSSYSDRLYNFHKVVALKGYNTSATVTHTRKQLTDSQGNNITPSKLVANPNYDASGTGETVDIVVSDNSGNSVTINEDQFGQEVSVSFADGNIQVEAKPQGDGSSTPEYYKTKVLGV